MEIKKSLQERALEADKVLLIGIGGGGDIIQCIPIRNYLNLLGVNEVMLGGVNCEWWPFDVEGEHSYALAPNIYDTGELTNAEEVVSRIYKVQGDTRYKDKGIAEANVAEVFNEETYVFDVSDGVKNLVDSINQFVEKENIDFVVGMDVGSDSIYSGETEISQPRTPLVDFITLSTISEIDAPTIIGLAGYGCDGEIEEKDLEENVGKIMSNNGYLGAYGLTQQDVKDLEKACDAFPDPVERWPVVAARGDFGYKNMKLMDAWGVTVKLSPLTSVSLFFDTQVVVNKVAKLAKMLSDTNSFDEAEEVLISNGVIPETRLPRFVNYLQEKENEESDQN